MSNFAKSTQNDLASAAKIFPTDPSGALKLYTQALSTAESSECHRILNNITLCLIKLNKNEDALQVSSYVTSALSLPFSIPSSAPSFLPAHPPLTVDSNRVQKSSYFFAVLSFPSPRGQTAVKYALTLGKDKSCEDLYKKYVVHSRENVVKDASWAQRVASSGTVAELSSLKSLLTSGEIEITSPSLLRVLLDSPSFFEIAEKLEPKIYLPCILKKLKDDYAKGSTDFASRCAVLEDYTILEALCQPCKIAPADKSKLSIKDRGIAIRQELEDQKAVDAKIRKIINDVFKRLKGDVREISIVGAALKSLKEEWKDAATLIGWDGVDTSAEDESKTLEIVEISDDGVGFRLKAVVATAAFMVDKEYGVWMLTTAWPTSVSDVSSSIDTGDITYAAGVIEQAVAHDRGREMFKEVFEGGGAETIMEKEPAKGAVILAKVGVSGGGGVDVVDNALENLDTEGRRGVEAVMLCSGGTKVKDYLCKGKRLTKLVDFGLKAEGVEKYGFAVIICNLCVSVEDLRREAFRDKEFSEEQYDKLLEMSKQKDPNEEKEMDPEANVLKRIRKVVQLNGVRSLVKNLDGGEMIATALCRMSIDQESRGSIIQQGGLTAAIQLSSLEGKAGKSAAHALAKLLVTTDPAMLRSEQLFGAIKPLIKLVDDHESSSLQCFEALLSLTNLAGGEGKGSVAQGIRSVAYAMFSDHDLVRRAATECMSNLLPHEKALEHFSIAEKMRIWITFARDFKGDFETARAAAGGLAMSLHEHPVKLSFIACDDGFATLRELIESGNLELMHRAFVALKCLLTDNDVLPDGVDYADLKPRLEVAAEETEVYDVLEAFFKNGDAIVNGSGGKGGLGEGARPFIEMAGEILNSK
ncbi:hypothetical protein TrST_g14138 [Triparma strigata]|uniref:UNC-45/Cro1/She4 central domain-containing protein n=1 Tax=Triparma strigata TaxID=1606541 RepID=A0A9W7AHD1_9STRA|nr:hypothetical protein TrST_g14138 [Triparma strigata]